MKKFLIITLSIAATVLVAHASEDSKSTVTESFGTPHGGPKGSTRISQTGGQRSQRSMVQTTPRSLSNKRAFAQNGPQGQNNVGGLGGQPAGGFVGPIGQNQRGGGPGGPGGPPGGRQMGGPGGNFGGPPQGGGQGQPGGSQNPPH